MPSRRTAALPTPPPLTQRSRRYSWSFALQAFILGIYLNGIAVWGRDDILTCEAHNYRAEADSCGCYYEWDYY